VDDLKLKLVISAKNTADAAIGKTQRALGGLTKSVSAVGIAASVATTVLAGIAVAAAGVTAVAR